MHKRKGKWVTISTSLVASLMVGASAQTLVSAQEDASNYIYTEDDSVAFDNHIYEENAEVESSEVGVDYVEPSAEDSVYIEETIVEPLVEAVPYYAEATVAVEAEWNENAEVVEQPVIVEEIPVEATVLYEESMVKEDDQAIETASVVEFVEESNALSAVEPDVTVNEEVDPGTEVVIDLSEENIDSIDDVVAIELVTPIDADELVEETEANQEVAEVVIPTLIEEVTDTLEDDYSEPVLEVDLPTETVTIEDVTSPEAIVDSEELVEEIAFEDVEATVELDDTATTEEMDSADVSAEAEEVLAPEIIVEDDFVESEVVIEESIEEAVEDSTIELPMDDEPIATEATEPDESLSAEAPELTDELEIIEDSTEEITLEIEQTTVTVATPEEAPQAIQTPDKDSVEDTVTEPITRPLEVAKVTEDVTPSVNQAYKISQGDTLWSLARKNNVSVKQLKEWNNLTNDTIIANASLIVANPNSNVTNSNDEKRQAEIATNPTTTNSPSQQNTAYTINSGDTLYSIARRHNVTVNDLRQWNNLTDDTIYANRKLAVANQSNNPTPAKPVTDITKPNNSTNVPTYTVNRGDTLWAIARRNNVTVAQLQEWNNISGNNIFANQKIVVSRANNANTSNTDKPNSAGNPTTPAENSAKTHTVNRGEYLYSIARQYDVTVNQLREWNKLQGDNVRPNEQLIVSKPGTTTGENSDATTPDKDAKPTESPAAENANKQAVIDWFKEREGKVTYSMTNRLGPDSYDCSSAVFFALMEGGYLPDGTWPGTTESLYALEGSLLTPINRDEVQAGDVFVAGHKGFSLGSGGHTGLALSNSSIIHSNYSDNGISTTPIEGYTSYAGMPTYWYRLNENFRSN